MLYVDSSAFVRRYAVDEPMHEECLAIMKYHAEWATSRVTTVEAPRAISRLAISRLDSVGAMSALDEDLGSTMFVDVDLATLAVARQVAVDTGLRTLDAIHLASALRVADESLELLTYDHALAQAAEGLGLRLAR